MAPFHKASDRLYPSVIALVMQFFSAHVVREYEQFSTFTPKKSLSGKTNIVATFNFEYGA